MTIAVIGGGGWGTALAALLSGKGNQVRLWVYEEDLAEQIKTTRENGRFLPGVSLPTAIAVTSRLSEAANGAETCL
ncbi:MAG TPA: 2-dehydropantoate 2-reductase N-terminal domain-containing protein, partial [Candidatus Eisenbacteria bacterium]|nr:2-dehydropantoate 2-reductase N-terminal domain-containing protein [Candidatus Eisenbacteria bacterium]